MDPVIEALFIQRALVLQEWNRGIMSVKVPDKDEMRRLDQPLIIPLGGKNAW